MNVPGNPPKAFTYFLVAQDYGNEKLKGLNLYPLIIPTSILYTDEYKMSNKIRPAKTHHLSYFGTIRYDLVHSAQKHFP